MMQGGSTRGSATILSSRRHFVVHSMSFRSSPAGTMLLSCCAQQDVCCKRSEAGGG